MRRTHGLHPYLAAALAAVLGLGLAGCPSAGQVGPGDDDDDDPPRPDGSIDPFEPDADPDEPDADPDEPDAEPDDDDPDSGTVDPDDPDAAPDDPDDPDAGTVDPIDGLGAWTGNDDVPASQSPPFGIPVNKAPMFVSIGFDDNAYSGLAGSNGTGGMTWATDMIKGRTNPTGSGNAGSYDGEPASLSFYLTSTYIDMWISESPTYVKRAWHQAYADGNEIGNHTNGHLHGAAFTASQWMTEIQMCMDWVSKPFDPAEVNFSPDASKGAGVPKNQLFGFRTPFLEYNDATLATVKALDFWYDCSIEDGFQYDHDGRNYVWPYTLDNGSAGHDVLVEWGSKQPIVPHPGLWELPVHPVIVPPDDKCAQYGLNYSLRDKVHGIASWFDVASGKITGFDYNLWVSFQMTKAEWLAVMKYTLDLRLAGNRAPFMFGAHTDYYSSKYTAATGSTPEQRQDAMEEFIDYALSKPQVRVVSNKQILDWVRNPTPLP